MLLLDILAIFSIGLMTGVEFSVSAFLYPVILQLDARAQAFTISRFAGILGKVMPFWYVANLLLLIAETALRLHATAGKLLIAASILWVAVIALTILFLVPINNRMMRVHLDGLNEDERRQHRRWNSLHRLRIAALALSMLLLLVAAR